jgi:DNA-directed RNA polymerase subunit RPC12/RpoP
MAEKMRPIYDYSVLYHLGVIESAFPRNKGVKAALGMVRDVVETAPTVSPDEARGVAKVNYDHGDYSCSACGNPARRLSFARKKFCDECGAKLLWEVSEDA